MTTRESDACSATELRVTPIFTGGDIGVGPDIVDPFRTTVKLMVVLPVTPTCGPVFVSPWSADRV